jgi:hypothetical protein
MQQVPVASPVGQLPRWGSWGFFGRRLWFAASNFQGWRMANGGSRLAQPRNRAGIETKKKKPSTPPHCVACDPAVGGISGHTLAGVPAIVHERRTPSQDHVAFGAFPDMQYLRSVAKRWRRSQGGTCWLEVWYCTRSVHGNEISPWLSAEVQANWSRWTPLIADSTYPSPLTF